MLAQRESSHRRNQSLLQRNAGSPELAEEAQLARAAAGADLAVALAEIDNTSFSSMT